jgi:hypothetical protein
LAALGILAIRMSDSVEVRSLDNPDGKWEFGDGSSRAAVQFAEGFAIGRGVYQPGWRWSLHAKRTSEATAERHIGFVLSGRMLVEGADGVQRTVGPGEAFIAQAGHDAWVVGDEPCVALDFIPG